MHNVRFLPGGFCRCESSEKHLTGPEEKYVACLIGLGIRKFSLNPRYIPRIREAVQGFSVENLEKKTQRLLTQKKVADIQNLMDMGAA